MRMQNVNITHFSRYPAAYQKVMSDLEALGWTVHGWAIAHKFPPSSVYSTLARWAGRNRRPNGGKAIAIMAALDNTFTQLITPQQLKA